MDIQRHRHNYQACLAAPRENTYAAQEAQLPQASPADGARLCCPTEAHAMDSNHDLSRSAHSANAAVQWRCSQWSVPSAAALDRLRAQRMRDLKQAQDLQQLCELTQTKPDIDRYQHVIASYHQCALCAAVCTPATRCCMQYRIVSSSRKVACAHPPTHA